MADSETQCSRCGDCCDPVIVGFDPQVLAPERLAELPDDAPEWQRHQYEFFRDHWTSTDSWVDESDGRPVHAVRCDQFDTVTRTCMAHDRQPQVCSGFPWYGKSPETTPQAVELSPRCSFNADVPGRKMLSLVEVR